MTTTFFKTTKKFLNDAFHEAKPSMLTFGHFPLFLLANEAILQAAGITNLWETVAIQMTLFALYALVMHTLGKSLFETGPKQEGYEPVPNQSPEENQNSKP